MKTLLTSTLCLIFSHAALAADSGDAVLVKQGEYLARAGDCVATLAQVESRLPAVCQFIPRSAAVLQQHHPG